MGIGSRVALVNKPRTMHLNFEVNPSLPRCMAVTQQPTATQTHSLTLLPPQPSPTRDTAPSWSACRDLPIGHLAPEQSVVTTMGLNWWREPLVLCRWIHNIHFPRAYSPSLCDWPPEHNFLHNPPGSRLLCLWPTFTDIKDHSAYLPGSSCVARRLCSFVSTLF